jgi:hypothetical protein
MINKQFRGILKKAPNQKGEEEAKNESSLGGKL